MLARSGDDYCVSFFAGIRTWHEKYGHGQGKQGEKAEEFHFLSFDELNVTLSLSLLVSNVMTSSHCWWIDTEVHLLFSVLYTGVDEINKQFASTLLKCIE